MDYSVRLDPDVEIADPSQATSITVGYRTHPNAKYGGVVDLVATPPSQPTWSILEPTITCVATTDGATVSDGEVVIGSRVVYNVSVAIPQGRVSSAAVRLLASAQNFLQFTRLISVTTSNDSAISTTLGSFASTSLNVITSDEEVTVSLGRIDVDDSAPVSTISVFVLIEAFVEHAGAS